MMAAVQSQILARKMKVIVTITISAQVASTVARTTVTQMWELLIVLMTAVLDEEVDQKVLRTMGENNKSFYHGVHVVHMNTVSYSHSFSLI